VPDFPDLNPLDHDVWREFFTGSAQKAKRTVSAPEVTAVKN
jgi:hypothetical protein